MENTSDTPTSPPSHTPSSRMKYIVILVIGIILLLILAIWYTHSRQTNTTETAEKTVSSEYMIVSIDTLQARAYGEKGQVFIPNNKTTTVYTLNKTKTDFSALKAGQLVRVDITGGKSAVVTILKMIEEKSLHVVDLKTTSKMPGTTIAVNNKAQVENQINKWKWINSSEPVQQVSIVVVTTPQSYSHVTVKDKSVISTSVYIDKETLVVYLYIDPTYKKEEFPDILNALVTKAVYTRIFASLNPLATEKDLSQAVDTLMQTNKSSITIQ